jgi:hypothetical protein
MGAALKLGLSQERKYPKVGARAERPDFWVFSFREISLSLLF